MSNQNLILLKYQDNFADNLSTYAYGNILSKANNKKMFYENNTEKRMNFEAKMQDFNLDYDYISANREKEISKKSFQMTKMKKKKAKF